MVPRMWSVTAHIYIYIWLYYLATFFWNDSTLCQMIYIVIMYMAYEHNRLCVESSLNGTSCGRRRVGTGSCGKSSSQGCCCCSGLDSDYNTTYVDVSINYIVVVTINVFHFLDRLFHASSPAMMSLCVLICDTVCVYAIVCARPTCHTYSTSRYAHS